ncbi:hypothetical protein NP233_g11389 [Leucocoprinus birnbaumii]|uniref:Uncharacterized protein n=1 Tax=Leucocoprinus birnbaumii TaxID=56174 RepID=A0AAD5VIK8_9AGAR|nr:hypothetical protein NP233_g11389 [Leucocoprinus birnbaumii]
MNALITNPEYVVPTITPHAFMLRHPLKLINARRFHASVRIMGKKKSNTPSENWLLVPTPPSSSPIVDTHTHLASTFESYRQRYKQGKHETVFDFLRSFYSGRNVESIVDVWCEAPVRKLWREFADSAVDAEDRKNKWDGINYWFVMGVHPHEAKHYNDEVEAEILEAMSHPRCVGWGEMGLDYHYDLSPRETQREVFRRQLKHAVRLKKPLTIHSREADEDTERILKEEVPREHPVHIHCFTDTPEFAANLLAHFPNLYIGITGVITYTTNLSTSQVIRNLVSAASPSSTANPLIPNPTYPLRNRCTIHDSGQPVRRTSFNSRRRDLEREEAADMSYCNDSLGS